MPRLFSGLELFSCRRPARDPTRSVVTEACDGNGDDSGIRQKTCLGDPWWLGGQTQQGLHLSFLGHSESF